MSTPVICPSYPDIVVTGTTGGSNVWGSNPYTDDSNIGKACVHNGLLTVGQTATIRRINAGYRSGYVGTSANGVSTFSYSGSWCSVYLRKVVNSVDEYTTNTSSSTTVDSVVVGGEVLDSTNDVVATTTDGENKTVVTTTTTRVYATPTTTTSTTTTLEKVLVRKVDTLEDSARTQTQSYGGWSPYSETSTPTTSSKVTYAYRTEIQVSEVTIEALVDTSEYEITNGITQGQEVEVSKTVSPEVTISEKGNVKTETTINTYTVLYERPDTVHKTKFIVTNTSNRTKTVITIDGGESSTTYGSWEIVSSSEIPSTFTEVNVVNRTYVYVETVIVTTTRRVDTSETSEETVTEGLEAESNRNVTSTSGTESLGANNVVTTVTTTEITYSKPVTTTTTVTTVTSVYEQISTSIVTEDSSSSSTEDWKLISSEAIPVVTSSTTYVTRTVTETSTSTEIIPKPLALCLEVGFKNPLKLCTSISTNLTLTLGFKSCIKC